MSLLLVFSKRVEVRTSFSLESLTGTGEVCLGHNAMPEVP